MATVSLEAFEHPVVGRRIVWILPPNSLELPSGFQEFFPTNLQRKVLLCTPQTNEAWRHVELWDSILSLQTPQDWSLALTHCLYQPNPSLVMIAPDVKVPLAFYQKIGQAKERPIVVQLHPLQIPFDRAQLAADVVVFPSLQSPTDTDIDTLFAILQQTGTEQAKQSKQIFKDILRDTRAARASVLVSTLGEQLGRASLYWYYATPQTKTPKAQQVLAVLKAILERNS